MTLGEFKSIIRIMVPSANRSRINDSDLEVLINKGVRAVNSSAKILIQSKYFDVVASQGNYTISSQANISDFILVGDSGLWFNKGSVASPNYRQLDSSNRRFLDDNFLNWYDSADSDPLYSIFEPNLITVYPAPVSNLTNGLLLPDYVYAPTTMDNDNNYPFFNTTTEIPQFEMLDDAIIDYVRWILGFSVGQKNEGVITRQIYTATLKEVKRNFKSRPDYLNNRNYKMSSRKHRV